MGDRAEPFAAVEEPFESGASAAAPPPASARALVSGKAGSAGGPPSEAATLVCAVLLAVALGIACGAWINTRLASAASITPHAPSRLLPAAGAAVTETPAPSAPVETLPVGVEPSSVADEIARSPDPVEPPDAKATRTDPAGVTDKERAGKRSAGVPVPVADEASTSPKISERPGGVPDVLKKATAGQGRVAPCAMYASAGSLTISGGAAAALVVGGPGEAGRVTVTTPDWADIAVLSEGRAGGNGWVRYSVRSVSKKAGVYTVRFTTPCGSQNIPVTVTRP